MSYIHSLLSVIILSFSLSAVAVEADQVVGIWWSPEQKTKVQISKNDNIYYGRIIAVRPESKDLLDTHHPDESLRSRHVLGT